MSRVFLGNHDVELSRPRASHRLGRFFLNDFDANIWVPSCHFPKRGWYEGECCRLKYGHSHRATDGVMKMEKFGFGAFENVGEFSCGLDEQKRLGCELYASTDPTDQWLLYFSFELRDLLRYRR